MIKLNVPENYSIDTILKQIECVREIPPPSFSFKTKTKSIDNVKRKEENVCILKYVTPILNQCALSIFTFIRPIRRKTCVKLQ